MFRYFVGFWTLFVTVALYADVKPKYPLASHAPPGYEPRVGPRGPVPFGPCGVLEPLPCPPNGVILEPAAEDCVLEHFDDTTNLGCNAATPLEAVFMDLDHGDTVCGHVFSYIGGPATQQNLVALAYDDDDPFGSGEGVLLGVGLDDSGTNADELRSYDLSFLPNEGTVIGNLGFNLRGLTVDLSSAPPRLFYGITANGSLISFQVNSLALQNVTNLGSVPGVDNAQAIVYRASDGRLVISDIGDNTLITVDPGNLAGASESAAITGAPGDPAPNGLVALLEDFGGTRYGVDQNGDTFSINDSVNPPVATLLGSVGIPHENIGAGAYDFQNGTAYVSDQLRREIDTLDLLTGDANGTRGQLRDTDWYRLPVIPAGDPPREIRWFIDRHSVFDGEVNLFIIEDTSPIQNPPEPLCTQLQNIVAATVGVPPSGSSVGFLAQPEIQYYAWISVDGFVGFACDPNDPECNGYVGRIELGEPLVFCDIDPTPPTSLWEDGFETYSSGDVLHEVAAPTWERWDYMGSDAVVVDGTFPFPSGVIPPGSFSTHTGSNALFLGSDLGHSDVVRRVCDAEAGTVDEFMITAWIFVPSMMTGDAYFILLNDFEHLGAKTWSHQLHFRSDGSIDEEIHGLHTGFYALDQWNQIEVTINLAENTQTITVGNDPLGVPDPIPWAFDQSPNVECIDLFAYESSGFFYDDVRTEALGPTPSFIRADVTGDGVFNALLEALFLLNAGFAGGDQPPCVAAADADGNRAVNPLTDSLFILNWGFFPGSTMPPAPFPDCGVDSNGVDILGCETPPSGCN